MNKLIVLTAFAVVGAAACSPSLRAETAGRVGCSAEEIDVGNASSVDGATTWTAWCRGQTYYCARVTERSSTITFHRGIGSSYTGTEVVSCTPAVDGPVPAAAPAAPERAAADSDPPRGAAGFDFAMDRDAAAKRCASAGYTWRDLDAQRGACSGTPTNVGFDAAAELRFCEGAACEIVLASTPSSDRVDAWVAEYARIRTALEEKYGARHASKAGSVDECGGSAARACLLDGRARPETVWRWRSGEALAFTMGKPRSGAVDRVELVVAYRSPHPGL